MSKIEIEINPGEFVELCDISQNKGKYVPKALMLVFDEMGEVINSDDFQSVSKIQDMIGSIARLGRAAETHLVLATQRASSNVISGDVKNNIQQSIILGLFDSQVSLIALDEDLSHMAKPEIKGRGFMKASNKIYEVQTYWTDPEKDFVFREKEEINQVNDKIFDNEEIVTDRGNNDILKEEEYLNPCDDNLLNDFTAKEIEPETDFANSSNQKFNIRLEKSEEPKLKVNNIKINIPEKENKFNVVE